MKKILIFGTNSYIGDHIKENLISHGLEVVEIDSKKVAPQDIDFTGIDSVVNVVGIAHIKITPDMESLFYKINTELAVELCKCAKDAGVKQYIYLSSMNVYGDTTEEIVSTDQEAPKNFYGKSKLEADKQLFEMQDDYFKIASVRPPVVYGYGCKGNFPVLVKLAKMLPIVPKYKNRKSMIYIEHLCEFIYQIVSDCNGGKFHPQDSKTTSTIDTIVEIRRAWGKKTLVIPGFSWAVKLMMKCVHMARRAFSDDSYSLEFSKYGDNSYCARSFEECIKDSVVEPVEAKRVKIAVMTTVSSTMASFSVPVAKAVSQIGWEPYIICNMTEQFEKTYCEKYKCINIDISRGFHPFNLLKTIFKLKKIFKREKFDVVQYGTENMAFCASIAARMAKVPIRIYEHWGARYVGYSGFMRFVSKTIEKTAARFSTDVRQVSFRNMEMCVADGIYKKEKVKVLGKGGTVGVDFTKFDLEKKFEYENLMRDQFNIPQNAIVYGFVGRIQSDKGVNELLYAYQKVYQQNQNAYLFLIGAIDDANPVDEDKMEWARECPNVIFSGYVTDVYKYMSAFDIMVHPTYREGFGMVLQEAAALQIPIITTDIIGPGEYIINDKTGVLVESHDGEALYEAMQELCDDEIKRNTLAENNYNYTHEFFERSAMVDRIIKDRKELLSLHGIACAE